MTTNVAWEHKRPSLKSMPKYSMSEPLVIREGVLTWRDAGGAHSMPTPDFIRRQIFGQAYLGVSWPIPAYFDLVGVRFHRAPISSWTEITGAAHVDWHVGMSVATEDADYAGVWYQACLDAGVAKVAGIGRQGDTHLTEDLVKVFKGGSVPPLGGLTVAQRVSRCVARAQELAYHLWDYYGAWDAFYIGHEVDHIAACTDLLHRIMYVPESTYPALKSYGAKIIIAISSPEDAAVSAPVASQIASWGADVVMEQGSVGTGQKHNGSVYIPTYLPSETIPEIPARSLAFAQMIGLAASIQGAAIEKVWNCEAWRMGTEPIANITLSALNGSSVTVTTAGSVATFVSSLVNTWSIYGRNGGAGLVTGWTSASEVTIDADAGDGVNGNFTELAMDAGQWSLCPGYNDGYAYPIGWPTVSAEIGGVDDAVDSLLIYGVDGYVAMPNAVAWADQSSRGRVDYKTRMVAQGNDWADAYQNALDQATVAWDEITDKPTTLAGFGITDALSALVKTAYTPSISFVTPGDLSVIYATQLGWYTELGDFVIVGGQIDTISFTHTTASGSLRIALPFVSDNAVPGEIVGGTITMSGWNKPGFTQLGLALTSGYDIANVWATGSGQSIASVTAADLPSGGALRLMWQITYKKIAI